MDDRIAVRKTYKLFINGVFPRSESGRTFAALDSKGKFLAHASMASRKDARDAVVAARAAQPGWAARDAYNRGQILYRIGEMMEDRRSQFEQELTRTEGLSPRRSAAVVSATIDRWVWYAGWADKYAQVLGSSNQVSGPYFNFSVPQATGVIAAVAPAKSSLFGLVSVIAPIIVSGNTVVCIAAPDRPLPAITLAEVLATSDLPAGVINLLTGPPDTIGPWLAAHADVNALDLTGVTDDALATSMSVAAADTIKVVLTPRDTDWADDPGLGRIRSFVETTTVWHPQGR